MIASLVVVATVLTWLEAGRLGLAWRRAARARARAAAARARSDDLSRKARHAERRAVVPPWRVIAAIGLPPLLLLLVAVQVVVAANDGVLSLGRFAVVPLFALPLLAGIGHGLADARWGSSAG